MDANRMSFEGPNEAFAVEGTDTGVLFTVRQGGVSSSVHLGIETVRYVGSFLVGLEKLDTAADEHGWDAAAVGEVLEAYAADWTPSCGDVFEDLGVPRVDVVDAELEVLPDGDGWIAFDGQSGCPAGLVGKMVEWRLRDGFICGPAQVDEEDPDAGWRWSDDARSANNVMAYRVADDVDAGWIEWAGGKRPVAADVSVEYRLRTGDSDTAKAIHLDWGSDGASWNIVAYRVVKP